jgi:anti-sigma regulatory factor (Ser/Thr protein kinase)
VAQRAAAIGLRGDRLDDFVFAVYEVLTNAVRHGGGSGLLRLAHVDGDLVCQVDDNGPGFTSEALSAQLPSHAGGRGLRLARQLTDALTITTGAPGTSVRIRVATR